MRSMRKLYVLLLSLAALNPSYAQDSILQSDANPQAIAEIKMLESTLSDLIVKGRWDEYAKSLASDYVRTIGEGAAEGREKVLATLRSGEPRIVAMIPEELDVHVYGDTAILTGNLTITASQDRKVRERHGRFTEVFIRRSGQWLVAATQITFIGK